jgi:signal transduction histidine kinase
MHADRVAARVPRPASICRCAARQNVAFFPACRFSGPAEDGEDRVGKHGFKVWAFSARVRRRPWPLALFIAVFLLVTSLLSMSLMLFASRMPQTRAREAALRRLVVEGTELVRYLGGMPLLGSTNHAALAWQRLPFLVDGLHSAQPGLQYVEIERDGVTIFHRQTGDSPAAGTSSLFAFAGRGAAATSAPVRVSRQWVERFGRKIPVMVFRQELPQPDGGLLAVEAGMRREAAEHLEEATQQAVRLMLRLALVTTLLATGICLLAATWAVRHSREVDARRRQEEHLIFSGMMANSVAHDFRNPMSSVRLDVQMLAREACRGAAARPARLTELAGRIGRTLERMEAVFQEFLFLARPAATTIGTFDLVVCAAECVETLAARIRQAGQRVALEAPPGQALVRGSASALRRALLNVIGNAVQHAPAGSVIEVAVLAAGRRWLLEVRDRGPGIPPQAREAVFEMFATSRPGGTGLGLFLARAAVTNCGGTIRALGREGGGTVIRIALRRAAAGARPASAGGSGGALPEGTTCPSSC